jgi:hypothetical protein
MDELAAELAAARPERRADAAEPPGLLSSARRAPAAGLVSGPRRAAESGWSKEEPTKEDEGVVCVPARPTGSALCTRAHGAYTRTPCMRMRAHTARAASRAPALADRDCRLQHARRRALVRGALAAWRLHARHGLRVRHWWTVWQQRALDVRVVQALGQQQRRSLRASRYPAAVVDAWPHGHRHELSHHSVSVELLVEHEVRRSSCALHHLRSRTARPRPHCTDVWPCGRGGGGSARMYAPRLHLCARP